MLVWINGPFGGGKTQTAHEIARRRPGSVICDPEYVGFGLSRMAPRGTVEDFQDWAAWRLSVVEVLERVLSGHDGDVIVPMTVVEPDYFAQTVGVLRSRGHEVAHFALLAERTTVVRRLRQRGFGHVAQLALGRGSLRRETFAMSRLDRCLERLSAPEFAEHISTDDQTVPQVADRIAASAGLTLTPNTDGPVQARARIAWTGVRHIRFG
jgi:AAA domain